MEESQYLRRLIDDDLDQLLPDLAAIALVGARGVGKTATGARRAGTVLALDVPAVQQLYRDEPELLLEQPPLVLVDEWQLVPSLWDVVRRQVDRDPSGGQFLLAGSAEVPPGTRIHSGAGRIVRLRMRPMALCERGLVKPTVSLTGLLSGGHPAVAGNCELTVLDYAREIIASGFPGIRALPAQARRRRLDGYLDQVVDHDLQEAGATIRRPVALRAWLAAYAAATGTTASYNAILDAATAGVADKPSRQTVAIYAQALERLHLLEPLPAWYPVFNHLEQLGQAPKHQLVDPALAARLLGATEQSLLQADPVSTVRRTGPLLGALFESLAVQAVRAIAEVAEARVSHLRMHRGEREIDLIVERADHRVVAIEVKLADRAEDDDVVHLNWLQRQLGERLLDRVVITTGSTAYRRRDGVAVVPLGLLGR